MIKWNPADENACLEHRHGKGQVIFQKLVHPGEYFIARFSIRHVFRFLIKPFGGHTMVGRVGDQRAGADWIFAKILAMEINGFFRHDGHQREFIKIYRAIHRKIEGEPISIEDFDTSYRQRVVRKSCLLGSGMEGVDAVDNTLQHIKAYLIDLRIRVSLYGINHIRREEFAPFSSRKTWRIPESNPALYSEKIGRARFFLRHFFKQVRDQFGRCIGSSVLNSASRTVTSLVFAREWGLRKDIIKANSRMRIAESNLALKNPFFNDVS